MNKLTRAFSYLIAANFQMVAIVAFSWWLGTWLNVEYKRSFTWLLVTIPFGIVAIFHTFYLVIRSLVRLDKEGRKNDQSNL